MDVSGPFPHQSVWLEGFPPSLPAPQRGGFRNQESSQKRPDTRCRGGDLAHGEDLACVPTDRYFIGALGNAVNNTLDVLVPLVIDAPVDRKTREKWLDRLWQAINDDGVEYLSQLGERWGEVCGSAEVAAEWADQLTPTIRACWNDKRPGGYFRGTMAGLSCLLAAGRHEELLDLLERAPFIMWHYRKYGVQALVAMGKKAEAIKYAEASRGLNDGWAPIERTCEEILLSSGLWEEAYNRYAFVANQKTNHLQTFRAIAQKYPMIDKQEILSDLIADSPEQEGKWFAAAKDLGNLQLALDLAFQGPCEPKTLNRAAEEHLEKHPGFAAGVAVASLKNLCAGHGYEPTTLDVRRAYDLAMQAAEKVGIEDDVLHDIRAMLEHDYSFDEIVSKSLRQELETKRTREET